MRRSWRNKFDLERDFVVRRALTLGGTKLAPGDHFDKSLVSVRRLRQLFDQLTIMFAGDKPGAIVRSPNDAYRRRHGEAAFDDGFEPERPFTADELASESAAWARLATVPASDADREAILAARAAVVIPADWAKMPWPARLQLAASLSDTPIKGKEDAAVAVNAELARRGTS